MFRPVFLVSYKLRPLVGAVVDLAIPEETYQDFFQLPFIQRSLKRYQVKLIIYDPKQEEIKQWIK